MTPFEQILLIVSILGAIAIIALAVWIYLSSKKLRKEQSQNKELNDQNRELTQRYAVLNNDKVNTETRLNAALARFQGIADLESEKEQLRKEIAIATVERESKSAEFEKAMIERRDAARQLETQIHTSKQEIELLNETLDLQSFGFYQTQYDFETPDAYKDQLEGVRFEVKRMLTAKIAAHSNATWTVNGSIVEGRKQTNQTIKLMVRAFNGESDAAIAKVKYNNVKVMEERIRKAYDAINSLVTVQQCYLNPDYLNLKLQELYLVHEYREKLQQAKEEQREIRARMRDDEIARREIEKALQDAERDETKYNEALRDALLEAETAAGARHEKLLTHIKNLERRLGEVLAQKERALSRAQLTRSGHVYVISNLGSFGENVYKIGMTRRLDPMDRVLELGDASVPFRFDVHAVIYCEDAPTLETQLHNKFRDRRLNKVNFRKEFFRVTLEEIAYAVHEFHGHIEFTMLAQAEEYRKTLAFLQSGIVESVEALEDREDVLE